MTSPSARPWVMTVPAKQVSRRSASGASLRTLTSALLATVTDSPVSMDSSTARPWASHSRTSDGTLSPELSSNRSPGTTCSLSIMQGRPSRMTRADPRTIRRRAEADFWAACSCTVPIAALIRRTATMKAPLGIWPMAKDTTAAIIRM